MRIDDILLDNAAARAKSDVSDWDDLCQRIIDDCHPDERAFVTDESRYIAEIVGRGGGKTDGMIRRFVLRMLRRRGARCFYVALTKDHARDIIWADLKKFLRSLGFTDDGKGVVYNETKLTATLTRNGASLKLVGADKMHDIDKLRGPTYAEVGIDEMGAQTDKVVRYLMEEVVGPRLVGAMCLGGTCGKSPQGFWYDVTGPGSTIGRRLHEAPEDKPNAQWVVHHWTLESAVEKTRDRPIPALVELLETQRIEIKARNLSPDNPQRRREFDAAWTQDSTDSIFKYRPVLDDGAPWCQWDPPRKGPMGFAELPAQFKNWVHVVSFDLGSSDPTSINVFAVALDDVSCTIYHRYGYEQKRLYAKKIAELLLGEHRDHSQPEGIIGAIGRWPNGMVADTAALGGAILDELNDVYGISIDPAEKGWRYKIGAIEVLNGDFFDGRFKVLKGSTLERQLIDLQWGLNQRGELCEIKGARNDAADSAVYGRQLIAEFITARGEAPPPSEEEQQRRAAEPERLIGVEPEAGHSEASYDSYDDDY